MASDRQDFEVSLRLGRLGKHTVTLLAPSASEAMRRATIDAMATSGGEFADWAVITCDRRDAAPIRRAA